MRLFRASSRHVGRPSGTGPTWLLAFVVLVSSLCLLWFVNRAAQNEQLAVRQKLVDAYRANLALAQERLQSHWLRHAADLDRLASTEPPGALFARAVRDDTADALVCYADSDQPSYPAPIVSTPETRDPALAHARAIEAENPRAAATAYAEIAAQTSSATLAARALQAQARCLIRTGDTATAVELLAAHLGADRFHSALDPQGRLIAPNAALRALELLPAGDARARTLRANLQARVLDYTDPLLGASQRRFILRTLVQYEPSAPAARLLAAEDLATQWIAASPAPTREPILRHSPVETVWQFASHTGRVVSLHRADHLLARLRSAAAQSEFPADVRLDILPPGHDPEGALFSLPAGDTMPGWRVALALKDPRTFAAATAARVTSYVWAGALAIVVVLALALLAWDLLRRQLALTRLRNDLVANVTHELKTPLSSMRLFVETLLDTPQLDERTTREYLALIAQENLRLSRLIDNFLTFSRIERDKYAYALRPVAPAALAEQAVAVVRERFHAPGCTFTVAVADGLPSVSADPDAFTTALVNLLDNAWKYTGEPKEIALSVAASAGAVAFAVRDNGVGLAPRDAKRIFQRFYQVRPQHSPITGGCGIGLNIVRSIIATHRGTIRVDSVPGRGSTFTITVPAA